MPVVRVNARQSGSICANVRLMLIAAVVRSSEVGSVGAMLTVRYEMWKARLEHRLSTAYLLTPILGLPAPITVQ